MDLGMPRLKADIKRFINEYLCNSELSLVWINHIPAYLYINLSLNLKLVIVSSFENTIALKYIVIM